ncbi:MAG: hypothetical protein M1826_003500 [Phylliscum demangeonii]|nr:MAG: hypothetical protein M1826_003500 [Phylliscum demangeonii]
MAPSIVTFEVVELPPNVRRFRIIGKLFSITIVASTADGEEVQRVEVTRALRYRVDGHRVTVERMPTPPPSPTRSLSPSSSGLRSIHSDASSVVLPSPPPLSQPAPPLPPPLSAPPRLTPPPLSSTDGVTPGAGRRRRKARHRAGVRVQRRRDNALAADALLADALAAEASAPDATGPDASTPDASMPDAAAPDASAPNASAPDASMPDASAPDSAVSAPEA